MTTRKAHRLPAPAAPEPPLDPAAAPLDFEEVYQAWFGPVCRWICTLGGPGLEVEDLAQEVFIVVERKLARFDGAHLAAWLYRITANTVSDARRRSWYRQLFSRRSDEPLEDLVCIREDPAQRMERKQGEKLLYRLLDRLPEKGRRALLLAEIEGCSSDEIARLEGIPAATARTRIFHARKGFLELAAKYRRQENA